MSLSIALAPDLSTILFLRFIQGLIVAVFVIVSRQIVSDISVDKKDQLYYTGILVTGVVLSPAIAPVFGAYIAHFLSWHWCFVFNAVLAAVFFGISTVSLLETSEKRVPLPKISELYGEYAVFFRSRTFNSYSAIITFSYGTYLAFITMSSFIYIERLDISPTIYSKVFLGMAGAFLCGNYLMQKLNKKNVCRPHIVACGLAISILGIIVSCGVYITHSKAILLVLLTLGAVLLRCGYAMIGSTAQVIVMNADDDRRTHLFQIGQCWSQGGEALIGSRGNIIFSSVCFRRGCQRHCFINASQSHTRHGCCYGCADNRLVDDFSLSWRPESGGVIVEAFKKRKLRQYHLTSGKPKMARMESISARLAGGCK